MVKRTFSFFLEKSRKAPLVLPAVVLAALFYSGVLRANFEKPCRALFPSQSISRLSGTVVSNPVRVSGYNDCYRVKVRLDSVRTKDGAFSQASGVAEAFVPASLYEIYSPGKLYSAWRGEKPKFLMDNGAKVDLEVVPKEAKGHRNGSARTKTEFHVTRINGCVWQKSGEGKARGVFTQILRIRALSRLHFTRLMYAWGNAGGMILALLSGSREYLPGEISEAFRNAGLSHILALSGMHLSLFSGMAFFLGKKTLGKRYAPAFELFAVIAFFWFAGKSPSLFRALICSLCVIFSAIFHIKIKSMLNVLAFSFLIHIAIFPADMFELGFMLSYGALAGILCFNEPVARILSRLFPYHAKNSLAQSVGAQAFTIPVCLRFFKVITPIGIVASAALSPIVTAFVYVSLAFIVLSLLCPLFAPIFGHILGAFYFVLERCVFLFAKFPRLKV